MNNTVKGEFQKDTETKASLLDKARIKHSIEKQCSQNDLSKDEKRRIYATLIKYMELGAGFSDDKTLADAIRHEIFLQKSNSRADESRSI